MNAISNEAHGMDHGLHRGALGLPRAPDRRRAYECLESGGFDYPLALFWVGYVAAASAALIVWLWS